MKIEVGQFGRFWNGVNRPASRFEYAFGYLTDIVKAPVYGDLYEADNLDSFDHFEPATVQPEWPQKKRRVIKDRAKLVRVLLDMGYMPNGVGIFQSDAPDSKAFNPTMFGFCGKHVEYDSRRGVWVRGIFEFLPEWTEEDDD